MDTIKNILLLGETNTVEFKRCGNGIGQDTYETVCSFLNRYGGDIYLGVEDSGKVIGLPAEVIRGMASNFVSMISNPDIISPTIQLTPMVVDYEGKQILHIRVPPSSEVHSFKKVIYDRVGDADVKVIATGPIAQMYIRKQKIYTEKKVYPYVTLDDLRLDMLPRIRQLAVNRYQKHPWKDLSDIAILQSAGLYAKDLETGQMGFNLAGIMLLGRDHIIKNVSPTYRTDALLRKVNVDRYDDRLIVETNLIESYDLLMGFAEKHLWDKFYLENDARISLRSAIAREILVNTLMHREFTSSYHAKFIIERDKMTVTNASRSEKGQALTPGNIEPDSKNPLIADFFRNIGLADELGSGVRNLYKYTPRYSGKPPEIVDGDVFRIVVPLDDDYSFDVSSMSENNIYSVNNSGINSGINELRNNIIRLMRDTPTITTAQLADTLGIHRRNIESHIRALKTNGVVQREGARKNGRWVVKAQ